MQNPGGIFPVFMPQRRFLGNFSGKIENFSRKRGQEPILNMSDL
jgi:hypothetical protein